MTAAQTRLGSTAPADRARSARSLRGQLPIVLLLISLGCGSPAAAQRAPERLRQTMSAFHEVLRSDSAARSLLPFFPRRNAWEFMESRYDRGAFHSLGLRRLSPEQTLSAIRRGGPLCGAFASWGELAAWGSGRVGRDAARVRPWRYVGSNRFVPPDSTARSTVFVQWRREEGGWVVSRIGVKDRHSPRVLGVVVGPTVVLPGTTVAPPPRGLAENHEWYRRSEPITYAGQTMVKFGLPRPIEPHLLKLAGTLQGVPAFVETGYKPPADILYVLIRPGEYQPYQSGVKVRPLRCRN